MRCNLDFSLKYLQEPANKESVVEKKNTDYDKIMVLKNKKEIISSKKKGLKSTKADWRTVYNDLHVEIRLRHYSPKTLKSYRGWVRQFQNFTKSKDPSLLSTPDVKGFLAHLAVGRHVAASTQNQAFNALLFFTGKDSDPYPEDKRIQALPSP